MTLRAITPTDFPWFDYSRYSFSLGLTAGDRAFLSGHSASEYDRDSRHMVVRGGMAQQARTAYRKIEAILDGAGFGFDDVVRVVENVTADGIERYEEAAGVRAEVFGSSAPAVSTVVVHKLLRPDAVIEIEVSAASGGAPAGDDGEGDAISPAYAADGVVYLSTIHPYDRHGDLVGEGDVAAQAEQIFRNARRVLTACGIEMTNVVNTLEMIHPAAVADYRHTAAVRKDFLGPVYPGAAGIVQEPVAADERVLLSHDFIASLHDPVAVNPGYDRYDALTYSPAVRAGNMLFMSGQAALDPETGLAVHEGDIVAQAEYTYRNIIEVLEAAGVGPEALVKTVEYATPRGLPDYRGTAAVRKRLLVEPYPASTGVLCHSLLRPQFDIEVVPLAVVPDRD